MMDGKTPDQYAATLDAEHLTEDQLDEVLMELAAPTVLEHAEHCTLCAERLEVFRSSMYAFNEATMAWSEARSSSLPVEVTRTGVRGWLEDRLPRGLNVTRGWTYAGVALAGLVIAVAGAVHGPGTVPQRSDAARGSDYFSSRQQEISNDNAMLSAISAELYQPVTIPESISEGQMRGPHPETALTQARD